MYPILLANKKGRTWLLWLLWIGVCSVGHAQQMRIEDFMEVKRTVLGATAETSSNEALLQLYTQETGFDFLVQGQAVSAAAGEGVITVAMPHKSTSLTIQHPQYGRLVWKVPIKYLKRKHLYRAMLCTAGGKEEFKVKRQWAVLYISPQNAVVTIDSTTYRTMDGMVQAYLPIGNHTYQVESPFYKAQQGQLTLTDSARTNLQVYLNPFYAYVEIDTHMPDARIVLDGKSIGQGKAASGRIMPGQHHVAIYKGNQKAYDGSIAVAASERKVIDLHQANNPIAAHIQEQMQQALQHPHVLASTADTLHITAFDAESEIWVNREKVGVNQATVVLDAGVHAISTRKEGHESHTQFVHVDGGQNQTVKLPTAYASYGWVNVWSNVIDANVYVDNQWVGKTPCLLYDLPTNRKYTIEVRKEGYRSAQKRVKPLGNELITIEINLKQK